MWKITLHPAYYYFFKCRILNFMLKRWFVCKILRNKLEESRQHLVPCVKGIGLQVNSFVPVDNYVFMFIAKSYL